MLQSTVWTRRIFLFGLIMLGGFYTSAVHAQVASNEFPPTVRTESNMQWKVTGKVTGPGGIPIPNAKVYLSRGCVYRPVGTSFDKSFQDFSEPVKVSVTGEYEINVREEYRLLFVAAGFAPLNVAIPDGSGLDIQLERGRTISGTILLPSGEPAVGVKVSPVQWLIPKPQSEIAKIPPEQERYYPRGTLTNISAGFTDFGETRSAITDNEGHFSIAQLPRNLRVGVAARIPGVQEEVIYVRAEEDSGNLDFESQIIEENEFTYQTNSCAILELEAIDSRSARPVQIAKVGVQPLIEGITSEREFNRRHEFFNDSTATVNMPTSPNGSYIYVEPKAVGLLGNYFEIPSVKEREVIERKVTFNPGKIVRGKVVSAENGEPVSGVRIRWRSLPDMKQIDEKGNFPRIDIATNSEGNFEIAVPDMNGVIGTLGRVPGFSNVTNWNERALCEKFAPGLLDVYTRTLRAGELNDVELEFRLPPCFRLEVDVVREGHSVPNCVVKGENREYADWSSNGWRNNASISVMTDEQGHAVIDQWYDNAFQLAKARHEATLDPEQKPLHHQFRKSPYPSTLQAFTDDGFNQGVVTVPIPDKDPKSYVIPLTIELKDPPSVLGRIVDIAGNGIGELEVTASLGGSTFNPSQTWTTKTKNDGRFKMQGLSFGDIKWKLDRTRVVTKGGSKGRIKIDTSNLQNGMALEVPSVVCVDVTELSTELANLDLDKLSNRDAGAELKRYIQEYIDKVPPGPKEYFSGWSGDDAVPSFMKRLRAKALVELERLADREPGSQFELELATIAPTFFGTNKSHIARTQGDEIDQWCTQRLMKNHIQNPDAQKILVDVVSHTTLLNIRTGGNQHWEKLLQSSQFKETRAAAASELVLIQGQAMRDLCKQYHDQESFDKGLAQLRKYIKSTRDNQELVSQDLQERGMPWLENSLKTVENAIRPPKQSSQNKVQGFSGSVGADNPNKMIESRAQAVYDLLHPYVESLRD